MKNSAIEWCNHSWNPWRGCLKVSPGCKYCYMYRDQERYGNDPKKIIRAGRETFNSPLKWRDEAKVFTCSWSDFFIEQADAWRADAWEIIRNTPHLTYQILTKRPENIQERLPSDWGGGYPNVWLGVSVETPVYLWRIDALSQIPSHIRFVSYEPALAAVDFSPYISVIDWLISGGESGYNPRRAESAWFVAVRDLCAQYGIAYFHKQNGGSSYIDGVWGGRELEGKIYHDFPETKGQPAAREVVQMSFI